MGHPVHHYRPLQSASQFWQTFETKEKAKRPNQALFDIYHLV
jgi:hypothetical protein